MEPKIILDLCGGTGSWSKPYRDAGYDVRVVTLPEYDVLGIDTYDAAAAIYLWNKKTEIQEVIHVMDIQGIFAAPPCTEFSLAKNNKPRNFAEAMKVVSKCLEIIWFVRGHKYSNLKFWAMENPRGFLRQFIGKPPMTFEHWEFGDKGIKPTDLWGYYKIPTKTVKCRPEGLSKKFPNGRINSVSWTMSFYPEEYKHLGIAALRAMTPQGFARAFFDANK